MNPSLNECGGLGKRATALRNRDFESGSIAVSLKFTRPMLLQIQNKNFFFQPLQPNSNFLRLKSDLGHKMSSFVNVQNERSLLRISIAFLWGSSFLWALHLSQEILQAQLIQPYLSGRQGEMDPHSVKFRRWASILGKFWVCVQGFSSRASKQILKAFLDEVSNLEKI